MWKLHTVFSFFLCFGTVFLQPKHTGSGTDGNLRLCVVENSGQYKRVDKYCPVLDEENCGVECVVGTDRLDCLRRITKGTVDFGVFHPEDLVAAKWANIDVLVTNQLKSRNKEFERSIVAVVKRKILIAGERSLQTLLHNTSLCQPSLAPDDLRPISDALSLYLETLVTEKSCNSTLSLTENRIKGLAKFFGKSCKPGPWVPDKGRDLELKKSYASLCEACSSGECSIHDTYWGGVGALSCLMERGDITWAERDDVISYFGLNLPKPLVSNVDDFAYLCYDGTWQPLRNNTKPCVWLERPWPVIVSKRKSAEAVRHLAYSLTGNSVSVDQHWPGALANLLQIPQLPEPLEGVAPDDYISTAKGFLEAYSQTSCNPPRIINLCVTSLLEKNKCEWLSEAATVYGILPAMQCALRSSKQQCLQSVADGSSDATVVDADGLVPGMRDYPLAPLLHETAASTDETNTVFAFIREDSYITKMADLRGKRAAFPRFDGIAWHSVLRYLADKEKVSCFSGYFSDVCAPGIEVTNASDAVIDVLTKSCYKEDGMVIGGEDAALKALVEGKTDVAFVSAYSARNLNKDKPNSEGEVKIRPICPEENVKRCYISWSNFGHVFTSKNLTTLKRHEIINVFTKMDQLFGKRTSSRYLMFSMYGPYNHKNNVIFNDATVNLESDAMFRSYPNNKNPLNFERNFLDKVEHCDVNDFANFSVKNMSQAATLLLSLVVLVLS